MNWLEKLLDLHKKHRWLAHVLFWAGVLLVGVSSSKYYDGTTATYGFEFITDALYQVPEMLAAYAVTYWLLPRVLRARGYIMAIAAFLLIAWLACVLGRIFIVKIDEPLAGVKPKAYETYYNIFTNIPKLLYVYFFQIFSIVFLFLCLKTLKDQWLTQRRALLLEKEKTETELRLLKAQLNPHFLFNTLNNIYSLSFTSQQQTSAAIARLADILDHILYRTNQRFVPLAAEVALIKNYLELEKLRYDSRLTVDLCVETDGEVMIAPLILLSLVENAFKHGASKDVGEPVIEIKLRSTASQLQFRIRNTLPAGTGPKPNPKERIGLSNLRQQLNHLYGAAHELTVAQQNQWFSVTLTIDCKQTPA